VILPVRNSVFILSCNGSFVSYGHHTGSQV